ncbi:hypothetical protein FJ364_04425, partial [Candidatus Dependentiae bacterium]|nr:hypothetical protein [Candidatus Dependentiae bacterium]
FWLQQEVFVKNLEQKFDQLDKDDPFNLDETALTALQELLHNVGADRLMVRSTGKEDTRTLANAGGNTSVPNVESTMEAVRNAAKEVVLSYFGRKSLEQRFGLGDKTLFDRDVFCPVLIQRMIGERQDDTTPPSCGVMFTEEPEGGISYKDEKDEDGRIKTTGITIIQAARGHNEGVVNSKVVVDTYVAQTIDDNPVFYPVIRHKHERLVPTPGAALRMVPNKPEIAVVSALNEATLTTLKKFADRLERHYSYPLDVEFVVRDNAVWIVQARPIVHKAELRTRRPSFIENLDELPLDVVSKGRTIVGFGGMITDIPDAQSVVIKDRIGAALDEYLHKRDRDKVKAVLSGSDAPATSHEATTFRGEGKPVLHLLDLVPSEAALNQDKKLALSPQQHCVVIVDKEKSIEKKEGWCAYPLPRELSVIPLLYAGIDPAWRPHVWRGKFDLKASLALMRDFEKADRAKVIEEAKVFPDKVFSWLNSRTKNVDLDVDLKVQIFSLLRATKVVCDRIGAMLNKADVTSLEVFLPINYLEALLYQQLDGEQELRYLSLARLGRTLLQEQQGTEADVLREKLVIKDPVAKRLHLQLQKADAIIFEERTQQAWSKLIDGLAHVDDNVTLQTVGKLTATLQSLDILPFWLHVSMAPSVTAFDPSVTSKALRGLVKTWVDGYQQHAKSFALIRRLRERVLSFNVDRFADPSQFNDAWKELLKAKVSFTVTSFTDMVFKDKTDEQLLLVAAVGVMQQFVDLFDRSIKAMKGSALWKKEEQSAQFKKMLAAYLSLLSMWCEKMTKQQKASLSANFTTVQSYLDMLAGIVGKNLFESKDLEPSQFAVAHFAMGAEHDFVKDSSSNTQKPATGEDAYTLIHQSLLNICSRLIAGGTVQDIKLPSLLQKIR